MWILFWSILEQYQTKANFETRVWWQSVEGIYQPDVHQNLQEGKCNTEPALVLASNYDPYGSS
jgi:hypothetical protein